ncbi:MAG: c-type cytochrome [Betaproteobacteria bacterium]|jgi:cytochrome c|nr:MAG: c-type cytochrome [Betaproteobacteria bacterium]
MKKGIISLMAAAALGLAAQAHAADAQELAKSKNCLTCHMVDKKLVGPAFKDVAAKYKGDSGAVADLSKKVINGASGTWGPIPMPPNPVSQEEAKALVEWILAL